MEPIINLTDEQIDKALDYSLRIIHNTKRFIDYAIAMADFMGEDFIPYCKLFYEELRESINDPNIAFEDPHNIDTISLDNIIYEYNSFKKEQEEKKRKLEFKENIDELQFLVKNYRQRSEFKDLLDYVGHLYYLAPYNAMLVRMQKPGAQIVFTGNRWEKKYGRQPKLNAQPLITLVPFGPVQCVFEYEDTEPIQNCRYSVKKDDIIKEWYDSLKRTKGHISYKEWNNLMYNLPVYGIHYDDTLNATGLYAGYLVPYHNKEILVPLGKENYIKTTSQFAISINNHFNKDAAFTTICHELGHLFCRHLYYSHNKQRDNLTKKEEEFEAETVSWLVCKRHGIKNPSEEYLAGYAPNGEIPVCSTEMILKAVTEIDKMLEKHVRIKDSLWYKEDKKIKKLVDEYSK